GAGGEPGGAPAARGAAAPPPLAPSAPPAAPATALAATPPAAGRGGPPAPVQFNGQTLRQVVHTTSGGGRLRVVFSNSFGTSPITVGAAGIALRDKDATIVAGSAKPLTFAGQATTTIPAGATMISDA